MISFVYFDVGGVVIRDFSGTDKWAKMKRDMGIPLKLDKEFDRFFDRCEAEANVGREVDAFIPIIEKKFGIYFPEGYSMLADFISRFEQNRSLWPIIYSLREVKRIGLLTNMYPRMLEEIEKKKLMPEVIWDVVVNSSKEGCKKPEREIFQLAEKRAGKKKSEILFIDNRQNNVDAAASLGWQTFLYNSANPTQSSRELSGFVSD